MMKGASGVLTGNFQVAGESALLWLREQANRSTPALALTARELMRWGFAHLHPATVANTVNFPLNHNRHTNRLFWRVDGQTLIGRFYLMHPIAVRPETMGFIIGSSCDYSFIPEMCPSDNVDVITDSDEFLVVEMQSRDHEAAFLRPGPLRPRALARTLSEWTTQHHRQNVRHPIVFHAGDVPETLDATIAAADRFIAEVERLMRRRPQPHRGHPYWLGALAAHHEATGRSLRLQDQWLALGLPEGYLTRFEHPFGKWLAETVVLVALGRPPLMRPWHPRWVDYALVLDHLREAVRDPRQRLLMIADRPTPFTVSFADGDEQVVSLRKKSFLESRPETYEPLVRSFDLCLVELAEEELAQGDELIDRVVPLMKPDGQILVVVYNSRTQDAAGFTTSIGLHATRLMRAGATLGDVHVVPASQFRWQASRASASLAVTAYHRPWVGLPLMAVTGGFLAVCSLLANAVARGRSIRALRPNRLATSFHMVLKVDAGGRDTYRYAARPILRQSRRGRLSVVDGPVRKNVLARRPDTTPILRGVQDLGEEYPSVGGRDGGADGRLSASLAITADTSATAKIDATREPQYQRLIDLRDEVGLTPLGLMTNQVWHDDPRRLGILLSRYKFVAKMLNGRRDVGEVGCGDAFGTPVVLQEVHSVTVYDFDPVFIADIRQRFSERWPIVAHLHDIVAGPLPKQHDGLYSLDVLEHIGRHDEDAYLTHLCRSLTDDGVLIIGSPSLESQSYASPQS
ncbi:MAG: class I SAM-dependent methyltransferase, partial [bacterium]